MIYYPIIIRMINRTEKCFVTATNEIFVAATKNFAAATKRFVDRTKHSVVVTIKLLSLF